MDSKYIKNLDKQKIFGIKSIRKIRDIDTFSTKTHGKLYGIKYFITYAAGSPKMIRLSSKNSSFNEIYGIEFYTPDLKPVIFLQFDPTITDQEFKTFLALSFAANKGSIIKIGKSVSFIKNKFVSEQYCDNATHIDNIFNSFLELDNIYIKEENSKKIGFIKNLYKDFKLFWNMQSSAMKVYYTVVGIFYLSLAIAFIVYYIKKAKKYATEIYTENVVEKEIQSDLFGKQTGSEPEFALMDKLKRHIQLIIDKKANALILSGPPGMSKTYTVRRTFNFAGMRPGKDYSIHKGSALDLEAVYSILYRNRDKIIIFDDFDTPLSDPEVINLLKAITDTYSRRIVSLPLKKMMSQNNETQEESEAPEKFEFTGQLIIITNLDRSKIDLALASRAPVLQVNYNTKEVLTSLDKLMKYVSPSIPIELKREVYNNIMTYYRKDPKKVKVDFRAFQSCVDARAGNTEYWKEMVPVIIGYEKW